MGKYIKKSKLAGDISVKEISNSTTLGFRTRAAKNLALLRLRSHSTSPSDESDSFHYLQLRSRRLVKIPLLTNPRKHQKQQKQLVHGVDQCQTTNPKAKSGAAKKLKPETTALVLEIEQDCNFEEKSFDFESEDRRKRETTPCSSNLIRESEAIKSEIEDFFAFAEKQQQRMFIEKYNFDIVSENPLSGRYEWVKVMP